MAVDLFSVPVQKKINAVYVFIPKLNDIIILSAQPVENQEYVNFLYSEISNIFQFQGLKNIYEIKKKFGGYANQFSGENVQEKYLLELDEKEILDVYDYAFKNNKNTLVDKIRNFKEEDMPDEN